MIVISGITSSIGISLAKLLSKKGINVTGFSRNLDKAKMALNDPMIDLIKADINDTLHTKAICKDAEFIVHLAALSSPWGRYDDFYHTNVLGTLSLINSASCTLKRFIHISTPSLYFNYKDQFYIKEEDPLPQKYVNAYAETKKIAEEVIKASKIPHIILRPRAVFGPYDTILFPRILKVCKDKGIPCFKHQSPLIDITYVDNVAHAIWQAISAPLHIDKQTYNITNDKPAYLIDILETLLDKLSIKAKKRHIPYPLAYAFASALESISMIYNKEPLMTRYGVGVMSYSQTLSIEKAKKELNYQPIISLEEGINRYVDWLLTQ